MAAPAILSADMATVAGWLRSGWRWWLAELAAMVPARLRAEGDSAIVLTLAGAGQPSWQVTRKSVAVAPDALTARERQRAVLVLDPEHVLCRTVALPALGAGELRAMIALDLDRLTPFPPGIACFDHEVVGRAGERGTMTVRIGALPIERVRTLRASAEALGVEARRIALRDHDGRLRFDFLAACGGEQRDRAFVRRAWTIVAVLFAVNVAALIWRDVALTEATRQAVEEQAPAARTAAMLRQRIDGEARRRVRLVAYRDRSDPLRILAALNTALPEGTWLQRLSWDGKVVRIGGLFSGEGDLLEALERSTILRDVRETDEGTQPGSSPQGQPFDISATALPGAAP